MNCVGLLNYSYFFMFLLYVTAGLAYSMTVSWPVFRTCWLDFGSQGVEPYYCSDIGSLTLIFTAALALFLCTGTLLLIQVCLLLLDWSTLQSIRFLQSSFSWATLISRFKEARFQAKTSRLHIMLLQPRNGLLGFLLPRFELSKAEILRCASETLKFDTTSHDR
jgi:hypothetical protein